jgi:hypothetical protein
MIYILYTQVNQRSFGFCAKMIILRDYANHAAHDLAAENLRNRYRHLVKGAGAALTK